MKTIKKFTALEVVRLPKVFKNIFAANYVTKMYSKIHAPPTKIHSPQTKYTRRQQNTLATKYGTKLIHY
jgi:hypothetical protein